jgi:hypothetical protein
MDIRFTKKFQIFQIDSHAFGIKLFPLAVIFFCRFACLSRQTGGGQSHRQTVQLGQNFKGLPNKSYCS